MINQDNIQEPRVHIPRQCIHCRKDIHVEATICCYCNLSQSKWHWLRYGASVISIILMFTAIAQVSIASYQLIKANEERVEAKAIKADVEKIRDDLREVVKSVVENEYILGSSSLLGIEGDTKYKKQAEANLYKLFNFVEPDEERKDKWLQSLRDLLK